MERSKNKNWSEDNNDRDDVEFWEQQKQEYLQSNPSHAGMFIGDDDEAGRYLMLKFDPFPFT